MKSKLDPASFEKEMPNIVRTAKKVEHAVREEGCYVIVEKQVKAGARKLIEALAIRNTDSDLADKKVIHIYVTKLDRTDIDEQLTEMEVYGIKVFKIQNENSLLPLFDFMDKATEQGHLVWSHLDEGDYGTAHMQLLSQFFYRYMDEEGIYFVDYSATNQEAILSSFNDPARTRVVNLEPGEHFKGAGWYLKNGLVKQAESFWDFENNKPTNQGQECIDLLTTTDKLFGVVRLVSKYDEARHSKAFRDYFDAIGVQVQFIDRDNKFKWGYQSDAGWKCYAYDKQKVLLVINQTCTRSTEVGFHQHIAFWHDYRNSNRTPYNTRSQAYERCGT